MIRRHLVLAALLAAAPLHAEDAQPALADLAGSRPLVVFADTAGDPDFVQQLQWLADDPAGDLAERRVVVLTDTDPADNGPLRRQLRPHGFGLVLIDTDGSLVGRRPLPATVRELSNMIDRKPSRRQETGSSRP